ncbi:uncharacterized protein LOC109135740 isoform X2 [Beta vulgaris subsp. vulgaris]|uniref:uncharacterized protein LOC109135740 isoform X2 n=1 Tax=Beta vulgaris subsp. vulgaris TaxID=3555 RepID=UPI002547FF2B|nr:uncharacterized protein LOC109135740 isoform X2 [Beta vulgaris subsp. vulgaris]XP_057248630.1 uncharacterized protein LOC109135740 isoform X2 [Beta vulgaris subsp. vulgaris]XP_057248632.1 uncharacterized protein LOC109135740 isoform X2 [Beta vulgaris subsp. vulgaris]
MKEGNRMRGALFFGDQVEGYKEAFVYKGEYEIANAPIKPVEEQFKSSSSELDYQMSFGRQTVIQPINSEANPVLPEYQTISSIPKACDPSEKFDILGVVLYVEEEAMTISMPQGRDNLVREIVITNHSTQQPLIISAWNDLAGAYCDRLSTWVAKFNIIGFTALKVTSHKGFSLASTMSTTIIHEANGDRAAALAQWELRHRDTLADRQTRVLDHDLKAFSAIQKLMQASFLIEVGPKTTLSLNNVLQLILKRVVPEDEADEVNLKLKTITQVMDYQSIQLDESNPKRKLSVKSTYHGIEAARKPAHEADNVYADEDVVGSSD